VDNNRSFARSTKKGNEYGMKVMKGNEYVMKVMKGKEYVTLDHKTSHKGIFLEI